MGKWENNIKMDIKGLGWRAWAGLIGAGYEQAAGCCGRGNEPSDSIWYRNFLGQLRNY
jgi:hypothetical protein